MTQPIQHPAGDIHRIWITSNYFLRVDSKGFIVGTCFEGALGCVVPLLSVSDSNRLALKIPRMLADTVRENAFISQVVNEEAKIVHRANEEYKAACGLIAVQALGRDVLRGIRELRSALMMEARQQDGCLLLFAFRKDRNPRCCSVKFEGDRRIAFPPGCDSDLEFLTRELWADLLKTDCANSLMEKRDASSYYFEVRRNPDLPGEAAQITHAPLLATIVAAEWSEVWFGALPSILYNWANGTLQEAVSQGRLQSWGLHQHYELCCRVLRGIDTLHSKYFLHGDLRPANIMTCGPANAPEDYVVGDYGSFSDDVSQYSRPKETGHTMVGGLGRHRASVFYAPERRQGIERETADVALILNHLDGVDDLDEYFVYFGWRSRLIDAKTNAPDEKLLRQLRQDWRRMRTERPSGERGPNAGDRLGFGDRLRVRDFIFSVKDASEFDEDGDEPTAERPVHDTSDLRPRSANRRVVFRCHHRFSQVLHERLTVYDEGPGLPDCTVISLPNYVELRQWSVATDMYGVGALVLYTVFMSGVRKGLPNGAELAMTEDPLTNAETLLSQMLEALEGIPSFLALWSDLEDFCWNLEHPENAELTGEPLARAEVRHRLSSGQDPTSAPPLAFAPEDGNEQRTIKGFALRTVNNLLRSVPNIRFLLHVFPCTSPEWQRGGKATSVYNAAHFLLFVHFVMACLHRRSHLRVTADEELRYPFCKDRCEPPHPGGPASAALARLEELKRSLLHPRYDSIVVRDKELVNFDPRDVMQIRIEHAQLLKEVASRKAEHDRLLRHFEELKQREDGYKATESEVKSRLAEYETLLGESHRALAARDANVGQLEADLEALQRVCEAASQRAHDWQVRHDREQSEMNKLRQQIERLAKDAAVREATGDSLKLQCQSLEAKLIKHRNDLGQLTEELRAKELQLAEREQQLKDAESVRWKLQELLQDVRSNLHTQMRSALDFVSSAQSTRFGSIAPELTALRRIAEGWHQWSDPSD
jgi:serine/threonine protein kinase